jgi:hypothetical protein
MSQTLSWSFQTGLTAVALGRVAARVRRAVMRADLKYMVDACGGLFDGCRNDVIWKVVRDQPCQTGKAGLVDELLL